MMAKPVVTPHSPERAALAAAHAAADVAARSLDEAEKASAAALEKLGAAFRAQEHFQALHLNLTRSGAASVSSQDHRGLIAALAGGVDVESPAAPPPDRLEEVAQQLADAESEIRKWREIRKITESEITARRVMLESARRDVAPAARAVAVATVDIGSLVEATTANVALLRQVNEFDPDDTRVHEFFANILNVSDALRHPAAQRLRDHREALVRDAQAALPE